MRCIILPLLVLAALCASVISITLNTLAIMVSTPGYWLCLLAEESDKVSRKTRLDLAARARGGEAKL